MPQTSKNVYSSKLKSYTIWFFCLILGLTVLSASMALIPGCGPACGSLFYTANLFAKPLIFAVFVAAVLRITKRRLEDMGLSTLWLVFLSICLVADSKFAMYPLTQVIAVTRGASVLEVFPKFLLAAFAFMAFLSVYTLRDTSNESQKQGLKSSAAGTVAVVSAVAISVIASPRAVTALAVWINLGSLNVAFAYVNWVLGEARLFFSYFCFLTLAVGLYRLTRSGGQSEPEVHPIDQRFGT